MGYRFKFSEKGILCSLTYCYKYMFFNAVVDVV